MVMNEVVAAIAAPRIGAWIWATPKRTRLSRAANRKAAVSGNSRSRVRQVLVSPRQDSETMPATIDKVPSRLVTLGRSRKKETAKRVANNGVALVKHEVIEAPSRSMPLKMKKRATPGTKIPTNTKIILAGAQRSIRSVKSRTYIQRNRELKPRLV